MNYHISTEVDSNSTWRQVPSGTWGPPAMTHAKLEKIERVLQISKHHLYKSREKLEYGLDDRFG